MTCRVIKEEWHGLFPPAAEGVPHGGMGEARTGIYRDRTHLSDSIGNFGIPEEG